MYNKSRLSQLEMEKEMDARYIQWLQMRLREEKRMARLNLATVWVVSGLYFMGWLVYLIVVR